MASRILGMGDVLSLIENAEQAVEADEAADMEKRMRAGEFTLRRLPRQLPHAPPDGAAQGRALDDPGLGKQLEGSTSTRQMERVEAIILSMTPKERRIRTSQRLPPAEDRQGQRRRIQEVNRLLEARKQMQKMMKHLGKGKLPALPPQAIGRAGRR